MSTYCGSLGRSSNSGIDFGKYIAITILLIIGSYLLLISGTLVFKATDHALTKHSTSADIMKCSNDKNKIGLILFNPKTGRTASLCEFAPRNFGRMIMEESTCIIVTAFSGPVGSCKNSLAAAVRNLVNQGYTQIKYVKPELIDAIVSILVAGW